MEGRSTRNAFSPKGDLCPKEQVINEMIHGLMSASLVGEGKWLDCLSVAGCLSSGQLQYKMPCNGLSKPPRFDRQIVEFTDHFDH